MEFAAMKNRGVKLFNRILNYVGCTNILYGAGSCVCFCRSWEQLCWGQVAVALSCSPIPLFHSDVFSSILELTLVWAQ